MNVLKRKKENQYVNKKLKNALLEMKKIIKHFRKERKKERKKEK